MTTDKEKFDSISVLYKQSWDNYNERRKYESKFSFGIYTVYAFSIAGILTQLKKETINCNFIWGVIILGGILFLIHLLWLTGANKANFVDRKIAIHFEQIMQKLSNSEFTDEFRNQFLLKTVLSKNKIPSILKNWSFLSQILISFCLYFALILAAVISK